MSDLTERPLSCDRCQCGHSREMHGFGMGECWQCGLKATYADEECDTFRDVRDAAEATR